ncbi:MAG TPA: hypothetical protein VMI10_14320 [Terriglobales bacterium]|nr:hypothetical protein [Terriglobales bacterium]
MKSIFVKGKPVSDEASKICILYNPEDGRVIHVHGVTIMHGGKEVSHAELEHRATAHAKALGRSVAGLKALHLPFSAIRRQGAFKVNSDGTGLVPLAAPAAASHLLAERRKIAGKRQ